MIRETPDGVELDLQIQPRASRTEVVGAHGDALKIRLAAPPVDGEANDELVRFLAKTLGVPKGAVTILSGATGRKKRVRVVGVSTEDVRQALKA
ncbi:MAG TPA: DUF167 family protein [Gemmatimonadales bacterium]|nr:DUF167 family protein [Gemmatimonadales bacterium]